MEPMQGSLLTHDDRFPSHAVMQTGYNQNGFADMRGFPPMLTAVHSGAVSPMCNFPLPTLNGTVVSILVQDRKWFHYRCVGL